MSEDKKRAIKAIQNKSLQLVYELEQVSPGLGGYVLNEAEAEGIPPEEVIARAIQFKALVQKAISQRLTVDQLLATFDIWDAIYRRALQSSFVAAQLWQVLAQVFGGFIELYSSIYATAKKASESDADVEFKKEMLRTWKRLMKQMQEATKMMQTPIMFNARQFANPYKVKAEVRKNEKDNR